MMFYEFGYEKESQKPKDPRLVLRQKAYRSPFKNDTQRITTHTIRNKMFIELQLEGDIRFYDEVVNNGHGS